MNSHTPNPTISIAGHLRVPRNTKLFAAACERWLVGRRMGTTSFRSQNSAALRTGKRLKDKGEKA